MHTPEGKEDHDPSTEQDAPACLETGRGTWSEIRREGQLGATRGCTEGDSRRGRGSEAKPTRSVATQRVSVSWGQGRWTGREDGSLLDLRLPTEVPARAGLRGNPDLGRAPLAALPGTVCVQVGQTLHCGSHPSH